MTRKGTVDLNEVLSDPLGECCPPLTFDSQGSAQGDIQTGERPGPIKSCVTWALGQVQELVPEPCPSPPLLPSLPRTHCQAPRFPDILSFSSNLIQALFLFLYSLIITSWSGFSVTVSEKISGSWKRGFQRSMPICWFLKRAPGYGVPHQHPRGIRHVAESTTPNKSLLWPQCPHSIPALINVFGPLIRY